MAFWNNPSELTPKQSHRWVISFGAHDSRILGTESSPTANIIPFYFAKSVDKPSFEIGVQQAKYLYSHTFNFPKRLIWKPITITFYDVVVEKNNTTFLFKPTVETINNLNSQKPSREVKQENLKNTANTRGTVQRITQPTFITEYYDRIKQSTQVFFYKFLQESGYFDPEEYDKEDKLLRFRKYNFKKDMIKGFVGQEPDFQSDKKTGTNTSMDWFTLDISELDSEGKLLETWKIYAPLITDVKFDKLDYSSDNILSVTATISYDWAKLIPAVKTSDKTRKVGASNIPEIDTKEQVREIDKQSQQYGYAKRYILEREIGVPGAIGLEKNIAPPSVSTNETFSEGQRATNNLELQIQSMNQELEALKYEDQIQNAIANIGKNTETI